MYDDAIADYRWGCVAKGSRGHSVPTYRVPATSCASPQVHLHLHPRLKAKECVEQLADSLLKKEYGYSVAIH